MADAEILTVARVYLRPRELWKSAHHTAFCSMTGKPAKVGEEVEVARLEFNFGVARHVPKKLYDLFVAAGIATTDRPKLRNEDTDED